jgi:hypothetical protein
LVEAHCFFRIVVLATDLGELLLPQQLLEESAYKLGVLRLSWVYNGFLFDQDTFDFAKHDGSVGWEDSMGVDIAIVVLHEGFQVGIQTGFGFKEDCTAVDFL